MLFFNHHDVYFIVTRDSSVAEEGKPKLQILPYKGGTKDPGGQRDSRGL